ncbi:MAG: PatB family C-S lyase [Pseudomonadota bacterium]|nr:PatB family C-S lyase [Pseudomonadota bacterium]
MVENYDFDEILDRTQLSTMKWEAEIDRLNDPGLLCLGTAEMDFRSATPIVKALEDVVRSGYFGYPYKRDSYYAAIIGYFERHFNWAIKQEWIASHVGIYPSMQPLIEELTEPGDEIVYQTPVHFVFKEVIEKAGRRAVPNPLTCHAEHYEIDFDNLEKTITPRTRMLLFCSPHNPVGRVWSRQELSRLHGIVVRHNLLVVSDEVYSGMIHGGHQHIPIASISREVAFKTVTLVSTSKSFNTTGLKHSLVIAENPDLLAAYRSGLGRSNLHFGSSIFGEAATEAAFRDCDHWTVQLMHYIRANFLFLREFIAEHMPMVCVTEPEAGYFAWLNFSNLISQPSDLKHFFERNARVVVTPGDLMGPGGENHVRINLGCPRTILEQALKRIAACCVILAEKNDGGVLFEASQVSPRENI